MLKDMGIFLICVGTLALSVLLLSEIAILIVEYLGGYGILGGYAIVISISITLVLLGMLLWLVDWIKRRWKLANWGN